LGKVWNSDIFRVSAATCLPVALEIIPDLPGRDPAGADVGDRQHPLPPISQDHVENAPSALVDPEALDFRPGDPPDRPTGADDEVLGLRSHLETE
jgi:hypothetical protein